MSTKTIILLLSILYLASCGVEAKKYFKYGGNEQKLQNEKASYKVRSTQDLLESFPAMQKHLEKQQQSLDDNQNSYFIDQLPGLDPSTDIVQYAGLVNINQTTNANIFFWLIQANVTNPLDLPLVIWINGGPCCSSMDGLFLETGPLRLSPFNSTYFNVSINPSSWHNVANVLYIDQPVGTGLSYVGDNAGLCVTSQDLEEDFYTFLQQFFTIFGNFTDLDVYISGESYAGNYIPHYSNYILTANDAIANKTLNATTINLVGVAIGNGWTHPVVQYDSYSQVAYAAGIITQRQQNFYAQLVSACQAQINAGVLDSDECDNVLGQLIDDSGAPNTTFVNVYDIRLYDPTAGDEWPLPGINYEAAYLALPEVLSAIHATATPHSWVECNDTCNALVINQDASSLYLFPTLLQRIRVLLYNGQFDLICNHIGTTEYLSILEWSGAQEWAVANTSVWTAPMDGLIQTAGYTKSVQNLTYLLALGGSHMYPMNMPSYALDMIRRFLINETYADAPQSLGIDLTATKQLTQKAWIGITVGAAAGGIFIGAIIMLIITRIRSPATSHYTRIQ